MDSKDFNQIYNQYKEKSSDAVHLEAADIKDTGKAKIVAVRKNNDGDIIAFKTDNGKELDYITALNEAKAGNIANIDVFHKYGRDIIRSEPDGIIENNLDNLPLF